MPFIGITGLVSPSNYPKNCSEMGSLAWALGKAISAGLETRGKGHVSNCGCSKETIYEISSSSSSLLFTLHSLEDPKPGQFIKR